MKLHITKTNRLTIRDSVPENYQGRPQLLETFTPSYALSKTKTMPSEIGLPNFDKRRNSQPETE